MQGLSIMYVLHCPTSSLTAFEAASRVAMSYNIVIANCDRTKIKTFVNNQ
jgi:hypothetical protein